MTAVAGLRGTDNVVGVNEQRPKNFRESILFRNPEGEAPIFALMARVQKESTNDPEFSWWDEPNTLVRLRVNKSGDYGTSETTIDVDSVDPDTSNPGNVWGVATHLKPGDLLLVEDVTDAATYDSEIIEVVSVISATQFTCTRGAAGTTAAAITDNGFLLLIGSVYSEGSPSPTAVSRNPIKYFNYTQIWKTPYELTNTVKQTHMRTGDPLQVDKRRKMFDHSRAIEQSILFGRKNEGTGANGKPKRTMDGLRAFIPTDTTTVFGAAVTVSSFLDAVYKVFDYSTPAGNQRVMLCGNVALNELNKVIQSDSNTSIQFQGTVKVFGMQFQEFRIPQGTLFLKSHPLLNVNAGIYGSSAWIIDFSALRWRPLRGRDTMFQDKIQGNDEDTTKGQWLTEAGLEVRFAGLTCGYLGNISAT